MAKKVIKTKFKAVYKDNGKSNVIEAKERPGVYIIKNKAGKIVYIGYSGTNVYKTLLRHFQSWKDKSQVRITYPQNSGYTVRIIYTTSARAAKLERALIVKYNPKDNPNKYEAYTLTKSDLQEVSNYEALGITPVEDLPF